MPASHPPSDNQLAEVVLRGWLWLICKFTIFVPIFLFFEGTLHSSLEYTPHKIWECSNYDEKGDVLVSRTEPKLHSKYPEHINSMQILCFKGFFFQHAFLQTSYLSFFLPKCTFWAQFFSTWKRVNCGKISPNSPKFPQISPKFPKISPHDNFLSTNIICDICDKYELCLFIEFLTWLIFKIIPYFYNVGNIIVYKHQHQH